MGKFTFWISMAMLHYTAGQSDASTPGCAVRCWENTKYVSKCVGDQTCLCNETEYQSSIYQCLYSQCDAAHFSAALHYTILQCTGIGGDMLLTIPPVLKRDSLRKRAEAEYLAGVKQQASGSTAGYLTDSIGFAAAGVTTQVFPTLSNFFPSNSAANSPTSPTSSPSEAKANTPADTTATSIVTAMENMATSAQPQLFTGNAPGGVPSIALTVMITVVATLYAVV